MLKHPKGIEKKLAYANERLLTATEALARKHSGGEREEFEAARAEVLKLERALAESRKEPYAIPCDFPVRWSIGSPIPYLFCSDNRALLTFYVDEPDPDWDGTYVNIVDPGSKDPVTLCLVTFNSCASAKLGHPNDEVQQGHALAKHGLEGYTAQIVENSPWLAEVAKTNSVHPNDRPEHWESLHHYVFWFHDSTFECLAESFEVEVSKEPMSELFRRVQEKLLSE